MKAEQDARMILGPIAAQKKERAADGASDPAANCLWFQQSRLRRIEQHLARFRVSYFVLHAEGSPLSPMRTRLLALVTGSSAHVSCRVSPHFL